MTRMLQTTPRFGKNVAAAAAVIAMTDQVAGHHHPDVANDFDQTGMTGAAAANHVDASQAGMNAHSGTIHRA